MRLTTTLSLITLLVAGCSDPTPSAPPAEPVFVGSSEPDSSPEPADLAEPEAPPAPIVEPEPVEPEPAEPEPTEPEPAEPEPTEPEPPAEPIDTDGDGIPDADDNCDAHPNMHQIDRDADGVGDVCDDCIARDELCDGIDNDCDGATDEGLLNACGACGSVPDEVCDGLDNDCDGTTDEDLGLGDACTLGRGGCAAEGQIVCAPDSDGVICDAAVGVPVAETCDAVDNDCDGRADEGFGLRTRCAEGVGQCRLSGHMVCGPDGDAVCSATPRRPWPETCEGRDNDCDGRVDEGVTNACGVCGVVPEEVCGDAVDNDCDGEIDEGFDIGGRCSSGEGDCQVLGRLMCNGDGEMVCDAQPSQPEVERCDGRDNDCDGETDEDARDANTCGVCGPQPVESCNGEDDDCDGLIDEDFDLGADCEGGLGDACRHPGIVECGADGRAVCEVPLSDLRACHAAQKGTLAVGRGFSCVAIFNGVKCFGLLPFERVNGHNQVRGLGADMPYVDLGMQIERISAGRELMCAHDILGRVKCAGNNFFGELGLGRDEGILDGWDLADRPFIDLDMQVEELVASDNIVCARGREGVKCWGRNSEGLLGLGHDDAVGDEPQEMGAALPYVPLGFSATALANRGAFCAIGHEADAPPGMKCWGFNRFGQLGVAEAIDHLGDDPAEMGDALPYVDLGMAPAAIASANPWTCALGRDGQVKCWGRPMYPDAARGIAGLREPLDLGIRAIAISSGAQHTCAIGSQGELVCWGADFLLDESRAPHRVDLGMTVVDVVLGESHGCALGGQGEVKCWGENESHQLGQRDSRDRDAQQPIDPIELY